MSDASDQSSTPLALRLRYGAEAAAFFAFIGFCRLLGLTVSSAVGGFIGRHIFYRIGGIMNRARANLRLAFPEKNKAEIEAIVLEMCDCLGRTVAEYAHLDKFSIHGPNPRLQVANLETAMALKDSGKGIMFFSGHFANWELMPFVAVQVGFEGGEVYRPQNNPYIDRWLVEQRRTNGPKDQIAKGAAGTRKIFTLLRRAKAIVLLTDQKTNEGIAAPFFGHLAMTTPAPAMLALRLGATLLPVSNERLPGSRFRMTVHAPIAFTPTGDEKRDIYTLTCLINDAVEKGVRHRPSQWLWIHRRWPTDRAQDQEPLQRAIKAQGLG
ncbi:MAG TPA: lysophospholipid acyltransferase family protein [Rhizomicrobium sp.]|jgi:KDO2-lipid IV(A) lauroyltransferase|nr:lysophospholipid acyltransferase family protein [Rhizomicrobium sp.]